MSSAYSPYVTPSRNSPPSSRRWRKSSPTRGSATTPPPFSLASSTTGGRQVQTSGRPQAIVMYWEDVLMPTSWMAKHLGLQRSTQSIEYAARAVQSSAQLQAIMNAIETRVMELIAQAVAVTNGMPVCILAEAPTAYVEIVSALFFPRLTAALRSATSGIYVVGTPDTHLDARELASWKKNMLHTVCIERFVPSAKSTDEACTLLKRSRSGQVNIITLCGSSMDAEALQWIGQVAPFAVLKSAYIGTGTDISLESFYDRLQRLVAFVKDAAASTAAMTARV